MSKKQAAPSPLVGRQVAAFVWQSLLQHELCVAGTTNEGTVRLQPSRHSASQRLAAPSYVEGVLLGRPQKVLALESARSQAAISSLLQRQMKTMGLAGTVLRLPLALAMLAHAATSDLLNVTLLERDATSAEVFLFRGIVSEAALGGLTAAEQDVTLRYLQGQSCVAIAEARCSRPRTVANQLAGVFHRFGTAGRFDLLRVVLQHAQRSGTPCSLELIGPALERPWRRAIQQSADVRLREHRVVPATTYGSLQVSW